mgnify:CR=1 FL=1
MADEAVDAEDEDAFHEEARSRAAHSTPRRGRDLRPRARRQVQARRQRSDGARNAREIPAAMSASLDFERLHGSRPPPPHSATSASSASVRTGMAASVPPRPARACAGFAPDVRRRSSCAPGYGGATARTRLWMRAALLRPVDAPVLRACGRRSRSPRPGSCGMRGAVPASSAGSACVERHLRGDRHLGEHVARGVVGQDRHRGLRDDVAGVRLVRHVVQASRRFRARRAGPPSSPARVRGISAAASRAC